MREIKESGNQVSGLGAWADAVPWTGWETLQPGIAEKTGDGFHLGRVC